MRNVTESKLHSSIGGAAVRSLEMENVGRFRDLRKLGIILPDSKLRDMIAMDASEQESFVMDASLQGPVTTASIPTPVQFLQNWLPGFVKIMTAARKIDVIVGINTVGSWEDEEIVQGVLENIGYAVPYGDLTNVPFASWNVNFEKRTNVRFEMGMRVGSLEEARAARIRVNSGEAKRESAGLALEIQRNLVGFYGYNAGDNRTYGLLNDPGLPAYVPVAEGESTSTNWSEKTFLEICADLRTAFVALRTQSQDTIDPETTSITLAIATNAVDYLTTVTNFGISVRNWLTNTYPRTRVCSAPQFNAANGGLGVFYLFADSVVDTSTDDGRTFGQYCPAKFQVLGVAKLAKGYEEDYVNSTAGVMCKRPYAVVRYSGISNNTP